MRVVHESGQVLAREVETADTFLSQGVGLMFRRSIPDHYALVFRFRRAKRRRIHTLFIPFSIDVCWLRDNSVQSTRTLSPWTVHASAVADEVIEFPAGVLDGVAVGDRLSVE